MEQALDQMRRVPGRDVKVNLIPGDEPGESILDVAVRDGKPISLLVSANNLAGPTVGRWQRSTLNLPGLSEVATVSIHNGCGVRRYLPTVAVPAGGFDPLRLVDLRGIGQSQPLCRAGAGEVQDFETSGRLDTVSG